MPGSSTLGISRLLFLGATIAASLTAPESTPAALDGPSVAASQQTHRAPGRDASRPALPPGVAHDWWTAIRARIDQDLYAVRREQHMAAGRLEADNPAQQWRAHFTSGGLTITPAAPSRDPVEPGHARPAAEQWAIGLRLAAYGRGREMTPVAPVTPRASGARVEFQYGGFLGGVPALTEWYSNEARGLEHGFTLAEAPGGEGPVTLELEVTGAPQVALDPDGRAVEIRAVDGEPRVRYADLMVWDAAGRPLPSRIVIPAGEPGRIHLVVDATGATYPITIDPLLTGSPIVLTGEAAYDYFGSSVATAGDVNGDGCGDVIVAAENYGSGAGRTYLYLGSPSGLATTPAAILTGEAGSNFGSSVATAGDVNGDGYADVVVGARGYGGSTGRAYVYLGSASGLAATPATTLTGEAAMNRFGWSVATAGDVNGDGFTDVVIGADSYSGNIGRAYVYLGGAGGLSTTPATTLGAETGSGDHFGASVATAGDTNGDGYADVVVGAPEYNVSTGRAYLYLGGPGGLAATPATTLTGEMSGNRFGFSAATAGDVNGDGYADVVVGATNYLVQQGKAYVYMGGASGLATTPATTMTNWTNYSWFGMSVATAGDTNGDGYADVVVGAPFSNGNTGAAYLYRGGPSGLDSQNPEPLNDASVTEFGYSVAAAGDVNGDGYADIVVGAPSANTALVGRSFVYLGGPGVPSATATATRTGETTNSEFGYAVATAGDVNGDGCADVVVGAPRYGNYIGRAYVFLGSSEGLASTPAATYTGEYTDNAFGRSVSTAGDVNGDGYADVIIGASRYASGTGRAYVYLGGPAGMTAAPAAILTGEATASWFGHTVGTAGDVNGDGYADVVVGAWGFSGNTGRAYVYMGGPAGLATSPARVLTGELASSEFGGWVGTAGDVNGDGYADLGVGAPGYSGVTGRAYVYLGGANGLAATPATTLTGSGPGQNFGYPVASLGDVNGDGYADLGVGSSWYAGSTGRAYVYLGGPAGLATTPAQTLTGEGTSNYFGIPVAAAGDVNGDGYADVLVGAERYGSYTGRAYLYLGGPGGVATSAAAVWTGEAAGSSFAWALATAGDVNGDGYADVVAGAFGYSTSTGRLYMYAGNGGLGTRVAPRTLRADGTAPVAYGGQSESATAFRLAALGRSPFGRSAVRLEWEVKPLGTLFDGTGTNVSAAWQDAGTSGFAFDELVSGLSPATPYHWRVRVRFHAAGSPFAHYSRWITQPWGGAQQTRLRTAPAARSVHSDFTGDLKSDILWRHASGGDLWLWPMDGGQHTAESYVGAVGDVGWEIRGLGDQTGDGQTDILWRHATTGQVYLWVMNGSVAEAETYVGTVDPAFDVVGTGDYDGDGKSDILWRHQTTGELWLWKMDGAETLSVTYVDAVELAYGVQGSGDLNGDGRADLVWQHATTGEVWVWLMNGPVATQVAYVATVGDLDYRIAGVADYTGDGKADLLWHHATRGEVWLWRMDGAVKVSEAYVATVPETAYRIVGTGDYDGDGQADILWHHATRGEVWVWLMDGAVKVSEHYVSTVPDTGYAIVAMK